LTTAVNIIDLNLTLTSLTISSSYAALTAITAFSKQQQKKKKYKNKWKKNVVYSVVTNETGG